MPTRNIRSRRTGPGQARCWVRGGPGSPIAARSVPTACSKARSSRRARQVWRLRTVRGRGREGTLRGVGGGGAREDATSSARRGRPVPTPAVIAHRRRRAPRPPSAKVRCSSGWIARARRGTRSTLVGSLVAAIHQVPSRGRGPALVPRAGRRRWVDELVEDLTGRAPPSPTSSTRCARSWSPWRRTSAVRRATSGPVIAISGPTTSGPRRPASCAR